MMFTRAIWCILILFGVVQSSLHSLEQLSEVPHKLSWTKLSVNGSPPSKRQKHSMTLLHSHQPLFLTFGGCFLDITCYNDIYSFSPHTHSWTLLPAQGSLPSPRGGHTAVSFQHALVVFGGSSLNTYFNDVIVFKDSHWKSMSIAGSTRPSPRQGHAAVVLSEQMYVFGGYTREGYSGELWVLDLNWKGWYKAVTSGERPSPRSGHTLVRAGEHKLVLFGGMSDVGTFSDVFVLDVRTFVWTKVETKGANVPLPVQGHVAVFRDKAMYVQGGCDFHAHECYRELFRLGLGLEGPVWERVSAVSHSSFGSGREGHSVVLYEGTLYSFGGCNLHEKCFYQLQSLELGGKSGVEKMRHEHRMQHKKHQTTTTKKKKKGVSHGHKKDDGDITDSDSTGNSIEVSESQPAKLMEKSAAAASVTSTTTTTSSKSDDKDSSTVYETDDIILIVGFMFLVPFLLLIVYCLGKVSNDQHRPALGGDFYQVS